MKIYKWLRVRNVFSDKVIKDASWADEIPKGWYKSFGEEMIEEINNILEKHNYAEKYRILQIKEKYGSLRWYDGGAPEELYDELQECISKYEGLSKNTCITCGEPATHMTKGWILPLCDECDKK